MTSLCKLETKCLCASFNPACGNSCLPTTLIHSKSFFFSTFFWGHWPDCHPGNPGLFLTKEANSLHNTPSQCLHPRLHAQILQKELELLLLSTLLPQRAWNILEDISQGHRKNRINITSFLVKIKLRPTMTKEILHTSSLIIFSTKDMKKKWYCLRKGLSSCSSSAHTAFPPNTKLLISSACIFVCALPVSGDWPAKRSERHTLLFCNLLGNF